MFDKWKDERIKKLEQKVEKRENQLRTMHRRAQRAEGAMAKLLKTMAPYINPPQEFYLDLDSLD